MNVLVTGGAGYVGSNISAKLIEEGHNVVIVDNLRSGHTKALCPEAKFYLKDSGKPSIEKILKSHKINLVVHAAASMSPSLSLEQPQKYFRNNIIGSLRLLNAMVDCEVNNIIFSSSGCVYGSPEIVPVVEDCLKNPNTPYGDTKLMFERILEYYRMAYGLNYVAFRYLNVAGACGDLGSDKSENNGLVYNVLDAALGKTEYISVFGSDYPTDDGTCVRDYVHIKDIVRAYVIVMQNMDKLSGVYNLGSGQGSSVMDIVECARKITGKPIAVSMKPRRQGDPPVLVSDISKSKKILKWKPKYSNLDTIIGDTWDWMQKHPRGYE